MSAAGCRKNANFGVDSNPWALDTLKIAKKKSKMSLVRLEPPKTAREAKALPWR